MKLVKIACLIPAGLVLEVGIERVKDVWGSSHRGAKYSRVVLNGPHAEWQKKAPTIQPVATLKPEPGLTQIPETMWSAWCEGMGKTHPARLNGLIFLVPEDKAEAAATMHDHEGRKTGFEPLDPSKLPELIEEAPVDGRPQLGSRPVRKD